LSSERLVDREAVDSRSPGTAPGADRGHQRPTGARLGPVARSPSRQTTRVRELPFSRCCRYL